MEDWNIGLPKQYLDFFDDDMIPSFQYLIIPAFTRSLNEDHRQIGIGCL